MGVPRQKAYGLNQPLIDVFPFPIFKDRSPTTTDAEFLIGQLWVYNTSPTSRQVYIYCGKNPSDEAIWVIAGPGDSEVDLLGCGLGDIAVAPQLGIINIYGANNQITTTGDDAVGSITIGFAEEAEFVTSVEVPLIIGSDSGSLNLKLGDNAGAKAVNILDSDDVVVASINSDGDFDFTDLTVENLTATGTAIDLGNSNTATTVLLGKGTGGNTVSINHGINTSANVTNIATGAAAANSTVNILSGNATGGTQTLNVLTGTRAGALNLATGAAAHVIAVGSASAGSISVDTGAGISLDAAAASNFTVTGSSTDLTLSSVGGSVSISSSEAVTDAIVIEASDSTGGVQIKAGSGGILIGNEADCSTIEIGNVEPTATSRTITISGTELSTGAIADTVDINVGGVSTSLTASKVVNILTGALDNGSQILNMATGAVSSGTQTVNLLTGVGTKTLNVGNSTGTTTNISGPFVVNDNVNSNVSLCTGTSTGSFTVGSTLAGAVTIDTGAGVSIDAATASNFTVTGAGEDLTLSSVGGSVAISATENAALALSLEVNGGASETLSIMSSQGTGVNSVSVVSTAGGLTLNAGLASDDAINLEAAAGGIDVDAAMQLNLTSSEAQADAVRIYASDAAGGIDMDCGTGGFNLAASNGPVTVVSGTGAITIGTDASQHNVTIGSTTGTSTTTLQAGSGGVNVTGNLVMTAVATQLQMNGGAATDFIGTGTLSSGVATINNTNIAATDRIFIQRTGLNLSTALGDLVYSITPSASFTITSLQRTIPASTETNDNSTFTYFIVREN